MDLEEIVKEERKERKKMEVWCKQLESEVRALKLRAEHLETQVAVERSMRTEQRLLIDERTKRPLAPEGSRRLGGIATPKP